MFWVLLLKFSIQANASAINFRMKNVADAFSEYFPMFRNHNRSDEK